MGLAHRVIPTILCRGRAAFKGKRFASWRSIGLASEKVRVHGARGVDELVLLDIGATPEGRGPDLALVRELTEFGFFSPLAVGGGVRSVADVKALLRAGADKVVIGTGIAEVPDLLRECSDIVGSQAIVAAVDVGYGGSVMIRCGQKGYAHDAAEYARWCAERGAGEILVTSIDREGTMEGYDLDLIRAVRKAVRVPVVAHGGCSGYSDMVEAVRAGANAVAAGALFQFTDCTPKEAAIFLKKAGIEARV